MTNVGPMDVVVAAVSVECPACDAQGGDYCTRGNRLCSERIHAGFKVLQPAAGLATATEPTLVGALHRALCNQGHLAGAAGMVCAILEPFVAPVIEARIAAPGGGPTRAELLAKYGLCEKRGVCACGNCATCDLLLFLGTRWADGRPTEPEHWPRGRTFVPDRWKES